MGGDIIVNHSILVVDDSLLVLKIVEGMLKDLYNIQLASSAEKALDLLEAHIPGLILLDVEMPKINGHELLEQIKSDTRWRDIPVIFLTGMSDRKSEERALSMGAADYILKPVSEGVLKKRIQMHLELNTYQKSLESLVSQKTGQLLKTQDSILDILANVTTYRDNDTGAHIIRTTHYSMAIVEKLLELGHPDYDIGDAYAHNIIKSAKLHDIGKIAIPDDILLKKGILTDTEFEMIKKHTNFGAYMITNAIDDLGDDAGFLITAREIILHHHERWDGAGYPDRLVARQIPVSARIMAIADVYDALISNRPYKKAFSHNEAVDIIRKEAGTHFDATLVDITESIFPVFTDIANTFKDE